MPFSLRRSALISSRMEVSTARAASVTATNPTCETSASRLGRRTTSSTDGSLRYNAAWVSVFTRKVYDTRGAGCQNAIRSDHGSKGISKKALNRRGCGERPQRTRRTAFTRPPPVHSFSASSYACGEALSLLLLRRLQSWNPQALPLLRAWRFPAIFGRESSWPPENWAFQPDECRRILPARAVQDRVLRSGIRRWCAP